MISDLANQKVDLYPKKYNCEDGGLEGGSLGVKKLWKVEEILGNNFRKIILIFEHVYPIIQF